ncbi:fumarate/nitrate reduction transcriptional regulator [compost metagenome]
MSPRLQEIMIKVLCNILALKDERIAALENHSVRNRVASVLLSLSEKFGKMTHQGQLIDVKIDRDTMAKLAGTVTESLSRQLSELEAEDIIHREGRFIYIKNKAKLEERARN